MVDEERKNYSRTRQFLSNVVNEGLPLLVATAFGIGAEYCGRKFNAHYVFRGILDVGAFLVAGYTTEIIMDKFREVRQRREMSRIEKE